MSALCLEHFLWFNLQQCIVEDLAVKQRVFAAIAQHCPAAAVITTNSMSLSCTEISNSCLRPEQTMGLRFLHPVLMMLEVSSSMYFLLVRLHI
jgi:3-hydroxyacyl-CoA dehydrogenase